MVTYLPIYLILLPFISTQAFTVSPHKPCAPTLVAKSMIDNDFHHSPLSKIPLYSHLLDDQDAISFADEIETTAQESGDEGQIEPMVKDRARIKDKVWWLNFVGLLQNQIDELPQKTVHNPELEQILFEAAKAVYDPIVDIDGFKLVERFEEDGFRIQSIVNKDSKQVIIAFRGTTHWDDYLLDASLVLGSYEIYHFLESIYKLVHVDHLHKIESHVSDKINAKRSQDCKDGYQSRCNIDQYSKHSLKSGDHKFHFHPEKLAEEYLDKRIESTQKFVNKMEQLFNGYNIIFTGHSLGGLFAQYAAMMTGYPGSSFNAPGVTELITHCKHFQPKFGVQPDFINHRIRGCLISFFGINSHYGPIVRYDIPHANLFRPLQRHKMINFDGVDLLSYVN